MPTFLDLFWAYSHFGNWVGRAGFDNCTGAVRDAFCLDAFCLDDNRLNALRNASTDATAHRKRKSGSKFAYALIKSAGFQLPFPRLAPRLKPAARRGMSDHRASGSPMRNAAKQAIKTDHWSEAPKKRHRATCGPG